MEKKTTVATAMLLLVSLSTLAGTSVGDAPPALEEKQEAFEDALRQMREHSSYGPVIERYFPSETTERSHLTGSVPLSGHDPVEELERDVTFWGAYNAGETEGLSFTDPEYHGTGVKMVDGPIPAIMTTGGVFENDGSLTGVVTKRDLDGNVIFETRIEVGEESILGPIIEDEEGNFFSVGFTADYSAFDFEAIIVKLNKEGDVLWTRTPAVDGTIISAAMDGHINPDGDLTIAGWGITNQFSITAFALKMDSDGNLLTSNLIGDPGEYRFGFGVTTDNDGNIYITGHANPGLPHFFLTKLDPDGNVLEDIIFLEGERTWAHDIAIGANGEVLIAGSRWYDTGDNLAPTNALLWSFDTDLNPLWETRARVGFSSDYSSVSVDGLGHIVLSGSAGDFDTHTGCALVSKLTMDGTILFHRCIADQGSGFGYDTDVSDDGSLIVTNGFADDGLFSTVSPGVSGVGTVAGLFSNIENTL